MPHREQNTSVAAAIVLALGAAMLVLGFTTGLGRTELAGILLVVGVLMALIDLRVATVACFYYLGFLGDLRRILPPTLGSLDPMLLIAPALAVIILLRQLLAGKVRIDTPSSKLVLVLLALMSIEIFNPIQGGFMIGFGGAVVYMVPILWYLIGKSFAQTGMDRKMVWYVLIPIATAGAALGLFQTFVGFLSFEARWVVNFGYTALLVGRVRPFGFFVSAAEYALFLEAAAVALIARLITGRFRLPLLLLPFLLTALFFESSRGPVALLLASTCAMWGAMSRTNVGTVLRLGMAGIVMVSVLWLGLSRLKDVDLPENLEPLLKHQVDGFTDMGHSTAGSHVDMFKSGIIDGFKNPFGQGIGRTVAASRMGGESKSSEIDISDMFICLGLGGFIYVAIVVLGLRRAVLHFRTVRTLTSLAIVGILVGTLANWISGALYAAAPMVCFLLGSIDFPAEEPEIEQHSRIRHRAQYGRPAMSEAAVGQES